MSRRISKQTKHVTFVFRGIIVTGLVLPIFVELISRIIFDDVSSISLEGSMAVIAGINSIPFFVLATFARRGLNNLTPQNKHSRIAEIIGAGVPLLIFTLHGHFSVWISIYRHLPGSSTSVIAFFFIPFYGFIVMIIGTVIGGVIGSLIGRLIKTKQGRQNKNRGCQ